MAARALQGHGDARCPQRPSPGLASPWAGGRGGAGGLFVDLLSWRWMFFVRLTIIVAVVALTLIFS
jgi:hypothetical protein